MTSTGDHGTWTGKPAGLIGIVILLLAGFCFGRPAVSLSPKDGPPTTTLRVSGSGFTPYAQIDIYFDSQDQALVMADAAGAFSQIAIQAPKSAVPGNHWVTAAERSGHLVKQEKFEVHVNWTEFHTKDMRRENPYENVLNVDNVGTLQVLGSRYTYGAVHHSPAVVDGVVYSGSDGNRTSRAYALNARTGARLWSDTIGLPPVSSPAVANGLVYIGYWDYVLALDASTGATVWSYETYCGRDAPPTVANGVVYVASADIGNCEPYVWALDAQTGARLWKSLVVGAVPTSPAIANGLVYIGSNTTWTVTALDASTGQPAWIYWNAGPVESSPAVANGVVYVGSDYGNVYALDAHTGALVWVYAIGTAVGSSSPAVANGVVYVGCTDGNVYALDAGTGAKLWNYTTGSMVSSSPAVANGVVYVGSNDKSVYALDAQTGTELWSYATGAPVDSSPAVANGVVYVGSADGNIYAFGLPKGLAKHAPKRPDLKTLRPDFNLKVYGRPAAGAD